MNRDFRAFEAFRRQRMAMLGAYSAWLKTGPDTKEIDEEICATADVMVGLSAMIEADNAFESQEEGVQ